MRRRNRHMEKISDIDFEDPSPFGEQSESNAPQAATGEIEFSALPEAQDAEGAKRRPAREDRRIVRPALARKRVKASFGSFAIDVERTDLADALAALLQAAPNAARISRIRPKTSCARRSPALRISTKRSLSGSRLTRAMPFARRSSRTRMRPPGSMRRSSRRCRNRSAKVICGHCRARPWRLRLRLRCAWIARARPAIKMTAPW